MKLDNRQTQTIGATSKQSETQLIIPHLIKIYFLSLSRNDSWIFGPSFLKEEPCFETNNNKVIVQIQQSNTQNKSRNSFINNTYPQINWSYYSSLDKLIRATSWIKNLKSS